MAAETFREGVGISTIMALKMGRFWHFWRDHIAVGGLKTLSVTFKS
jgi:hypothetical protein